MIPLSEQLKAARKRAGLSFRKAARACGLSTASVVYHEQGKVIPRARTLSRIARIYGLPSNYFRQAREKAIAQRQREKLEARPSRFRKGDIIKGRKTKNITWRVLTVHRDGTLAVERVIQPPCKTIKRPEEYHCVEQPA